MIHVDQNIPLPEKTYCGHDAKYPFRQLKVGESFCLPDLSTERSIRACVAYYRQRYGLKFTVRRTADGGVRVWRTE
jgi:hypothetical protein